MHCASLPGIHFHPSRTDEVAVNGSLVTDLGLGPEVWLFLSAAWDASRSFSNSADSGA